RAFNNYADLLLHDEPRSLLDTKNEKRFRNVVDDLAATRAVLVVAHRLSTVRHADHVVMVTAGALTDSGTHDDLMERCEPYRELVTSQTVVGT
ncbi:ABC transporter ATP-binding protein, partial [Streptomyces sp. NPDC127044]